MLGSRARPRARWSRGQALTEFALVAPVMVLILLVAIDFGESSSPTSK